MKKLNSKELLVITGGYTPPTLNQISGDLNEMFNTLWGKMEGLGERIGCWYKRTFGCD